MYWEIKNRNINFFAQNNVTYISYLQSLNLLKIVQSNRNHWFRISQFLFNIISISKVKKMKRCDSIFAQKVNREEHCVFRDERYQDDSHLKLTKGKMRTTPFDDVKHYFPKSFANDVVRWYATLLAKLPYHTSILCEQKRKGAFSNKLCLKIEDIYTCSCKPRIICFTSIH